MSKKTRDGLKISNLVRVLMNTPGIEIRKGSKHQYVANYPGMRPCPIATSTDARRMVAPWYATVMGYSNTQAYQSLAR